MSSVFVIKCFYTPHKNNFDYLVKIIEKRLDMIPAKEHNTYIETDNARGNKMKKEFFLTSNDGQMMVVVFAKNLTAAKNIAAKLFKAQGH
jgi:hypothetical protein